MPTQGFNIKSLMHDGFKLNVWDIGGICRSNVIEKQLLKMKCSFWFRAASESQNWEILNFEILWSYFFHHMFSRPYHLLEEIYWCRYALLFYLSSEFQFFRSSLQTISGQKSIRPYWRNYYDQTDALVRIKDAFIWMII